MESVPFAAWAGRVLSGIAVAFLLFDAAGKLMRVAPVVEGSTKLGYPESAVFPIGHSVVRVFATLPDGAAVEVGEATSDAEGQVEILLAREPR